MCWDASGVMVHFEEGSAVCNMIWFVKTITRLLQAAIEMKRTAEKRKASSAAQLVGLGRATIRWIAILADVESFR